MWSVTTEGNRITVNTGQEEIIGAAAGTILFRKGQTRGERCGNEDQVAIDLLGQRAVEIHGSIRAQAPSSKIQLSPHGIGITCAEQEICDALKTISTLGSSRKSRLVVVERWLSDRMVRYAVQADEPLTNTGRTLAFDSAVQYQPIDAPSDQAWRRLGNDELTNLGEKLLAAIAKVATSFGVTAVTLSRGFFDFCFLTPYEGIRREVAAWTVAANLSFAL